MTKTLISISLIVVVWTGQPSLTVIPFSINFESFHLMIPLFIVFAIWHFKLNKSYLDGYTEGMRDMTNATIEELKKRTKILKDEN